MSFGWFVRTTDGIVSVLNANVGAGRIMGCYSNYYC